MNYEARAKIHRSNAGLMTRHFPTWRLCEDGNGEVYFEGWHKIPGGKNYQLRLFLPPGTPEVSPKLYVWNPIRLSNGWFDSINSAGASHEHHTLSNGLGGRVQICHTKDWDATITYVSVVLKGILWLTAYDGSRKTPGKSIRAHFEEWRATL